MVPLKTWLVWVLRKASYRWPSRYQALKDAKVGPNTFKCASCHKDYKKQGKKRIITVDHIIPCKDPKRPNAFQDDLENCKCGVCDFLRKMFCLPSGLQVLCKECHDKKTESEMGTRMKARRKKKEDKNATA